VNELASTRHWTARGAWFAAFGRAEFPEFECLLLLPFFSVQTSHEAAARSLGIPPGSLALFQGRSWKESQPCAFQVAPYSNRSAPDVTRSHLWPWPRFPWLAPGQPDPPICCTRLVSRGRL